MSRPRGDGRHRPDSQAIRVALAGATRNVWGEATSNSSERGGGWKGAGKQRGLEAIVDYQY